MLAPKFREVILGPRRSSRGLQGLEGRHDRRLLRADPASSLRNAKVRVLRDSAVVFESASSSRCGASRTTSAKSPRTSSAACRSRSSRISSRATSSRRLPRSLSRRSLFLLSRCRGLRAADIADAGTPAISHPAKSLLVHFPLSPFRGSAESCTPRCSDVGRGRPLPRLTGSNKKAPVRPSLGEPGAGSLHGRLSVLGLPDAGGRRDQGRALGSPLGSGGHLGWFRGRALGVSGVRVDALGVMR